MSTRQRRIVGAAALSLALGKEVRRDGPVGDRSGRRSAPSSASSASGLTCRSASSPELTSLSNPYLSQVERGLHQPSVRVLKAISDALNLSAETMLTQPA